MIRLAFLSLLQIVLFLGISVIFGPNVELLAFFIAIAVNAVIILSNPRAENTTLPILSPFLSMLAASLVLTIVLPRPNDPTPSMLVLHLIIVAIVWVGAPLLVARLTDWKD